MRWFNSYTRLPFRSALVVASICLICGACRTIWAQGTKAATASDQKATPPAGIEVSAADRAELERDVSSLESAIKEIAAGKDAKAKSLLPDVQIYSQAVRGALDHNEFFATGDIAKAKELLKDGRTRADQLAKGEAPWTKATGLVVRGYVSKIDGSVQPYGLVVPESYVPVGVSKYRLDVWLHGRNEKLSELNFLDERRKKIGDFHPDDTFVLHPYGRYCNAFKFAGEIDVLEAIDAVKKQYRIDDDRIAMRGFSMGGAGCWHLAVHYPDHWMAAAPGAGFAETEQYTKMSDDAIAALPDWQRKLFHWYDCPDWAMNLYHCPTIAYSGEDDPQKQSADIMEEALQKEGLALRRVIGPHTKHAYYPESKTIIDDALASIADAGGRDRNPAVVHFVTYTLRYPRLAWVQIDGLAEHWQESRIDASLASSADPNIDMETKNVTDLTLAFPPGWAPFDAANEVSITIDNEELSLPRPMSDRSWKAQLYKNDQGEWQVGAREEKGLRKRPGLQGPIDDAFLDSFIFVRPSGKSANEKVEKWVQSESDRAIKQWRDQFRGEARVKKDSEITDEDVASSNLILWGDATSNAVIKRIADRLPIRWDGDQIVAGEQKFSAADHVPLLIYPNPLNPKKYVVLNSGFTFREADTKSNALQVPRLPDWAIIDIRTPPDANRPGKIEAADFFGEKWELHPSSKENDRRTAALSNNRR